MPERKFPIPGENRFHQAVHSSLEALLTDLQNTTEVLKRAHLSNEAQRRSEPPRPQEEPIYEPQRARITTMSATNLDDLDGLLSDYPGHGPRSGSRPTVESLLGELDNAVPESGGKGHTAGKDLDNLMASLSEFPRGGSASSTTYASSTKQRSAAATPVAAPENGGGQLDTMLSGLQTDMSRHGISTIPKGDCAACQKTIVGQVVIALGKMWHPEHFLCAHCGEELGHRNFFERSSRAYCENDYHNLFSPRCAYCNGAIKDRCVTALDKTWHPDHFVCAHCGKEFGAEGFHEKDGKAYCRADFFAQFAPKCRGCQRAIAANFITALNTQWHPECFVCQECKSGFEGGSFFEDAGMPFCETHYHGRRGSLCAACGKPISGRCVTAMGKRFHPEHFVCSFCLQQLNKGTFKEHEEKPYCHKCFTKLLS